MWMDAELLLVLLWNALEHDLSALIAQPEGIPLNTY